MLADLLNCITPEKFTGDYWLEKPYATHGRIERLPKCLRSGPMQNLESLLSIYRGRVNFSRGSKSQSSVPAANSVAPIELYNMGLTLYLGDVADALPDAAALLREFERELGLPQNCSRLGVFASPTGEGAPCHYDAEEVFSIQLRGSKTFEIAPMRQIKNPVGRQYSPGREPYADLYPQVDGDFPNFNNTQFKQVKMEPGSVLYLPRGTWHRSCAHSDSFAVSVIANPPVVLDAALAQLRKILLQSPAWRAPLTAKNLSSTEKTLQTLPNLAKQLDINHLEELLIAGQATEPYLKSAVHYRLNPQARLLPNQPEIGDLLLQRRYRGGAYVPVATLALNDAVMSLALSIAEINRPFTASELLRSNPSLNEAQVMRLLELLLQAGVVATLDYPIVREREKIAGLVD